MPTLPQLLRDGKERAEDDKVPRDVEAAPPYEPSQTQTQPLIDQQQQPPFVPQQQPPRRSTDDVVVRCSKGHFFTTIWIPLVSFKAIRLGNQRFQRCPVGRHWALIERVPDAQLTDEQRDQAAAFHDVNIP